MELLCEGLSFYADEENNDTNKFHMGEEKKENSKSFHDI